MKNLKAQLDAKNYVAKRLPNGRVLTASLVGDRYTFEGGKYGKHDITNKSSNERLVEHWHGYQRANGANVI